MYQEVKLGVWLFSLCFTVHNVKKKKEWKNVAIIKYERKIEGMYSAGL